jgi:hypothetical protein
MARFPLLFVPLAALLAATQGCASPSGEDSASDQGAFAAGATEPVATFAPSVRVLDSYNALLDRTTATPCVVRTAPEDTIAGDIDDEFYLSQVKSKEDLARNLEVDVSASYKVPAVSVSASVKVVHSFEESSSKVVYLIRAATSYSVMNISGIDLSPMASSLLRSGTPSAFAQKCGASYVTGVRYQADVAAILEFEATSAKDAHEVEAKLGVKMPLVSVNASVKSTIEQLSQNSRLTVRIVASGFNAGIDASSGKSLEQGEALGAIAALDGLRKRMSQSIERDLDSDRGGYSKNSARNAHALLLYPASYSSLPSAPAGERLSAVTKLLTDSRTYYDKLTALRARMTTANAELEAFLTAKDPSRFNRPGMPVRWSGDLVADANAWHEHFRGDVTDNVSARVGKLASLCLDGAGDGDYTKCVETTKGRTETKVIEDAIGTYEKGPRVVELRAFLMSEGRTTLTTTHALGATMCTLMGMRLPRGEAELQLLAPMVAALSAPSSIWYEATPQCATPAFTNDRSKAQFTSCASDLRALVCVLPGGLVPKTGN